MLKLICTGLLLTFFNSVVTILTCFQIHSHVVVESIIRHLPVDLEASVPLPKPDTLEVTLQSLLDHLLQQLLLREEGELQAICL